MSDNKPFYISQNTGFAPISAEDDLLHPQKNSLVADAALTETQYFGFSVPEHNIHAIGYLAYGDCQEGYWNDYLNYMSSR